MKRVLILYGLMVCVATSVAGQSLHGTVHTKDEKKPLEFAVVFLKGTNKGVQTNTRGVYNFKKIPKGTWEVGVKYMGYKPMFKKITITGTGAYELNFEIETLAQELDEIEARALDKSTNGLTRLNEVEGTAIYAAKKNEVLVMSDITANTASNNARQVFSKVAGLNIWESDGAGLQLGIAARGLNPSRTSGFNTRLNGYDMSADAIGYPESYYTPPTEALERIEVVRGAASLQYGTQFGGMLNFIKKKGSKDSKAEVVSRQTIGSYGFLNSFNSVGGTVGKLNYYTYAQHKQGNGWRQNSDFNLNSVYTNLNYHASKRLTVSFDITLMKYLAQQAGGLTDQMFENNPQQSIRDRNWFEVTWNLAALRLDYDISERTRLNSRTFGLLASRKALGYLGAINRQDPMEERNLLSDAYKNYGNETRLLHTYKIGRQMNNFLVGFRFYKGYLKRQQGLASSGFDADFSFLNNDDLEGSNYIFPSKNVSLFMENVFRINPKLSITPGMRIEYILTSSDGYFNRIYKDLVGNILEQEKVYESNNHDRLFPLFGLGVGYYLKDNIEAYANFSQNFRAITFNDMRVNNPSLKVDTNLQDERGYNADLGIRGNINGVFSFDATVFYLAYYQRIGTVQLVDPLTYRAYRFRTNVADARTIGIESLFELDILKLIHPEEKKRSLSAFTNISLLDARYIDSEESAYQGKKVELVPNLIMKYGVTYRTKENFSVTYNLSRTSQHYTDATNAEYTPNAVNGIVPAYYVMDVSMKKKIKRWALEVSCNNLTNNIYFTRRADGYPGPGIIPAEGRTFYFTLEMLIGGKRNSKN